jgi:hypothetical protein
VVLADLLEKFVLVDHSEHAPKGDCVLSPSEVMRNQAFLNL